MNLTFGMTAVGLLGSLLDSVLGAVCQASVVDVRTGKVVEGEGGRKVLVKSEGPKKGHQSRKITVGRDILSNNGVNLVMAGTMAVVGMAGAAWVWDIDLTQLLQ
jgi:uncharacterized membrane protein